MTAKSMCLRVGVPSATKNHHSSPQPIKTNAGAGTLAIYGTVTTKISDCITVAGCVVNGTNSTPAKSVYTPLRLSTCAKTRCRQGKERQSQCRCRCGSISALVKNRLRKQYLKTPERITLSSTSVPELDRRIPYAMSAPSHCPKPW